MRVDTSLRSLPAKKFGPAEARHLAQRAGFGATPAEVADLAERGLDGAVEHLLEYQKIEAKGLDQPDIDPDMVPFLDKEQRRAYRKARKQEKTKLIEKYKEKRRESRREDRRAFHDLQQWWLTRMIDTPRPMEEKLTLLWHDHFATSYQKVRDAYLMYEQNQLFREHAAGSFAELLAGVVRDPAMLEYLDNQKNRKRHPNENLGRELMELFTLGEGNYTEKDIKEASRALTGYAFDDNKFKFRRNWHDPGRKRILGESGKYGAEELVRILLARRACSEFIAYKLYQHLVADISSDPKQMPEWAVAVIKQVAKDLRDHDYELRPALRILLKSRHFYDKRIIGQKIKSPTQLVVGTARSLDTPTRHPKWLMRGMQWMGQELFEPPNVSGWEEGKAWINSSTLFVRQNVSAYLITGEFRGKRRVPKGQSDYDPMVLIKECDSKEPGKVADYLIDTLLGDHVPKDRRQPVVSFAKEKGEKINADELSKLLVLITAMPEYQLC